jgi:hypothetical protein
MPLPAPLLLSAKKSIATFFARKIQLLSVGLMILDMARGIRLV